MGENRRAGRGMGSESFHMSTRSLSVLASALAFGATALRQLTDEATAQVVPLNLHAANELVITFAADAAELADLIANAPETDVSALADHVIELTSRVSKLEDELTLAGITPGAPPAPPPAPSTNSAANSNG